VTPQDVSVLPELRFPDFVVDWNNQSLSSVSNEKLSNGVFNDPKKVGTGYPLINVKDMYGASPIDVDSLELLDLSEGEFSKNSVLFGDIFFTRSSLVKEGIAHSNVFLDDDVDVTYDGHLIRLRPTAKIVNSSFLHLVLKTSNARRQLIARGKTGTMTTIGQDDLNSVSICIPSLPEQKKIAGFLSAVDDKLTAVEAQLAGWHDYKRGMMQALFSQTLRFKADDGSEFSKWERKQIGDVLTIGSGKDYKGLGLGKVPVYGTGGLMTFVDEFLYDGESVGIGRKGTIDKPVYLTGKFWTVDTLFYTHSFEEILPKFVYAIFQRINWKKYNEASGVPSLSKKTIEKIDIKVPSLPEQQKIADALSAIDSKIEVLTDRLEATREFKRGLLQKMFV